MTGFSRSHRNPTDVEGLAHIASQVCALNVVAGFGFRAGASAASLKSALNSALEQALQAAHTEHAARSPNNSTQLRPALTLTLLATPADKAEHPALIQLANELRLNLSAIALEQLNRSTQSSRSQPVSPHIPARYGACSVAESSALAAAGAGAQLLAPRSKSADKMATAAIAVRSFSLLNLEPIPL